MSALFFLMKKEVKNSFLDLLRHPVKLIAYILLFAMLSFSIFERVIIHAGVSIAAMDIRILHGVYFGALLLLGVPILLSGMKSGATFFKMHDVNFLFPAPISPRKILLYGLLKQMASVLLLTVFLIFYGVIVMDIFGIGWGEIVLLLAGLVLGLFQFELIAMLAYNFSNRDPRRAQHMRAGVYVILAAFAIGVLYGFSLGKGGMDSFLSAMSVPLLEVIPVFGWLKGLVFSVLVGNITGIIIYGVLVATTIFAVLLLLLKGTVDYYEGVVTQAEADYENRDAERQTSISRHGKARVSATGLGAGWGSNVFFFKHIREGKRRSPVAFIGFSTLLLFGINLVIIFLLSYASSAEPLLPDYLMGISLVISCYVLFFYNTTSDWVKELSKPYIYLVPESCFQKLLWAGSGGIVKAGIEGVLLFLVMGVFTGCAPFTAVACMLIYTAMGVFFLAGNILSVRLFGKVGNKGLLLVFQFLLLSVLLLPGVWVSFVMLFSGCSAFLSALPLIGWALAVSGVIILCCRDLLLNAEL